MSLRQPLWTKNFILICFANLMLFTSFYFLLPTLPVFVTEVLKGDEGNVGYIIGILSLTAVLVRPLAGYLLDAVGRRLIFIFALLTFALAVGTYNYVTTLALLFILRALHGISWGFATTGAGTVAADVVPETRRGEGMGYYGLSNTLAMAVGPSLGLYILHKSGFSLLFLAGFIIAIIGLISILGITYQERAASKAKSRISFESFFEPKVFSLSGIMFFVAVVYSSIVSFITLYGKEIGIDNPGVYFLIYALSLLFVRPYAGGIFDKKGPLKIMPVGFTFLALSFVLLSLAQGYSLFIASAVALGVGFGIVQPTSIAMAINRVEPFRRGAANGTIFSAFDLGIGLGSIVLGFLSAKLGLANMYLVSGLIALIPMMMFQLKDANNYRTNKLQNN